MALEWIKMRRALVRHPKVLWMADVLAGDREFMDWLSDPHQVTCHDSAYDYVTCQIMVSIVITGLLEVWSVANEIGTPVGGDLIVAPATVATISDMAGVPVLGEALAAVGWIVEEENYRVRFPNFLKHNVPAEERHRLTEAEREATAQRQREHRARQRELRRGGVGHAGVEAARKSEVAP
jgi:hypothetical protein